MKIFFPQKTTDEMKNIKITVINGTLLKGILKGVLQDKRELISEESPKCRPTERACMWASLNEFLVCNTTATMPCAILNVRKLKYMKIT